jgi:hypothetical protein
MKIKRKFRDADEQVFCYLCEGVIVRFPSPESERIFSESGLCPRCQRQMGRAFEPPIKVNNERNKGN